MLPISYGDAQPLLAALAGQVVPESWRGALPITYHVGPGPAKVHLVMKSNWDIKPIYDVIAKIPGSETPDEWVIRGNHHDAWVNGAEDPISGMTAVLEEARSLGELLKQGWKPKRTIIYCAWDGEEPGLLGSTEWVEEHGAELNQHAVVYINSDSNARGFLYASGSHTLEPMVNAVARDVLDPETKLSVQRRAQLRRIAGAQKPEDRESARGNDLRIGALGDGSDYASFLDHAGVASLNIGFGGESQGGIYHSIYDDFYWYTHFGDPDFVYERALSQLGGTMVMRMADADLLPFDPSTSADTVSRYVKRAEDRAERKAGQGPRAQPPDRRRRVHRHRRSDEAIRPSGERADAALPELCPAGERRRRLRARRPPLQGGLFEARRGQSHSVGRHLNCRPINQQLIQTERTFTTTEGLKERPWFKHQIYAPGAYTGYGVKTIPAVREMMEEDKWQDADNGSVIAGGVLMKQAALVDSIAAELEKVVGNTPPATKTAKKHGRAEEGQISGR